MRMAVRKYEVTVFLIPLREGMPRRMCKGELPQIYNIPNPFSAVVVSPAHRKPTCWLRNANLSAAKTYASRFQKAHKAVI